MMSLEKKNNTDTNNYKNIVESLPVAVVIYTFDGRVLYVNPKAVELSGIGQKDYSTLNIFDFIAPEYLKVLEERRKNIAPGNELPPLEIEIKNIKGETVYVEINSASVIYNDVPAMQTIITDTTARRLLHEERIRSRIIEQTSEELKKEIEIRKQSEQKILSTQAQLTAIVNNSTDIVLSIDRNYNIVKFNKLLAGLVKVRYGVELMEGQPFPVLEIMEHGQRDGIRKIYEQVFSEGKSVVSVETFVRAENKEYYFETNYNPIKQNEEVTGIAIFSRDITEKIKSERENKGALKEKEVLLKEVHHRVKNNLQVISSILNLQTSYVKDKETANILKECQNRIKTMAYIHESLYQTKDFLQINFTEYITNLVKNLFYSYDANQQKIIAIFDIDPIFLNLDTSIPCGLIINELVSNALKYAFTDKLEGAVNIKIKKSKNNKIKMIVADNGKGMPDNIDYKNTETLGLQLVTILAEQIDGTITLKRTKGTIFEIIF
jgi:PAS domain S-box-containing protein